jgi:RNA-binding protein YlmH
MEFTHLTDLANTAYNRGICTYSDFLGLNELNLFYSNIKEFSFIKYAFCGGYSEAERRVICFYEDSSFPNIDYPISALKISPVNEKFSDRLTHRDYLGAVLNLGIDRSKIGDIVCEEAFAYLFCRRELKDFLSSELLRVKHTSVSVTEANEESISVQLTKKEVFGSVSSVRLDTLLSIAFHSSRSGLSGLIRGGKVFVNGRLITSQSFVPKEGDIISVRGMGRFQYLGADGKTKKSKDKIKLLLY